MTELRPLEIREYGFGVPPEYFIVPLESDVNVERWLHDIVAESQELLGADPSGDTSLFVEQLREIRRKLVARNEPFLRALVSVRPEIFFSVGAVVTAHQIDLGDDGTIDEWERLVREQSASSAPGIRSRDLSQWRETIEAGEVAGSYQRVEYINPGDPQGVLTERVSCVVFPPGAHEAVEFTFVAEDFRAFADMRAETHAIVETLWLETGVA